MLITLTRLAAALMMSAAQSDSGPPIHPPGRLIDVGGWNMHIYCTGVAKAGSPTVVLEAGAGDFSVEWSLVQPGISKFTRVCSYDRSDDGWSDWFQIADELSQAGRDVLLDDRDARPGEKFADADLLGAPLRVTVGRKSLDDGAVDVRRRSDAEDARVPRASVIDWAVED